MKQTVFSLIFSIFIFFKTDNPIAQKNNFSVEKYDAPQENLLYPSLVNRFYEMNGGKFFWIAPENEKLREELFSVIDSASYAGLIAKKYHYVELKLYAATITADSIGMLKADRLYTDAAIAVFKDIFQGYKDSPWVEYDQLSNKYADSDNEYLLHRLLGIHSAGQLQQYADSLEPAHKDYAAIRRELKMQKEKNKTDTANLLSLSMNYYRWIHHFRFDRFIVINLAAARLQYYEKDSLILDMKTVVGKPSTPSPRFATLCDRVILYPYWYVPGSIIFNEYLPKIKSNPSWLDGHNMQVIDGSGRILDHHKLNWSSFHAGYFPYIIRQSTGCDNALGVIKFNIITPYGVYLHDTNNKTAFLSASRYYSHGCIRLEEPIGLGNRLLNGKLDTTFLKSCFKEQKPVPILLEKPVPVFAVYMPATVDANNKLRYYKDVYKLIK
jgi:murein L,D-transpeptidase YcbB/YkuD